MVDSFSDYRLVAIAQRSDPANSLRSYRERVALHRIALEQQVTFGPVRDESMTSVDLAIVGLPVTATMLLSR